MTIRKRSIFYSVSTELTTKPFAVFSRRLTEIRWPSLVRHSISIWVSKVIDVFPIFSVKSALTIDTGRFDARPVAEPIDRHASPDEYTKVGGHHRCRTRIALAYLEQGRRDRSFM